MHTTMGLTLYAAPAIEPLTLSEIKAHCRVTHADDDTYLLALVSACREYAETITRRSFINSTWRLTLDEWPTARTGNFGSTSEDIVLPRSPVSSVTSITYIDTDRVTQTLAAPTYELSTTVEPSIIRLNYGREWPSVLDHPESIVITFVAGYGAQPDDIPERVRTIIKLHAAYLYENREVANPAALAASDVSVGYEALIRSLMVPHL